MTDISLKSRDHRPKQLDIAAIRKALDNILLRFETVHLDALRALFASMIFVVTAGRGSVGKSTWAHALIELLRALGFAVVVVDADRRRPNLSQAYQTAWNTKTYAIDLTIEGSIGTLAEIIEENRGCPVVLNLGAEADVNLSGEAIVETINDLLSITNRDLFIMWLLRREADGPRDLANFLTQNLTCTSAAVLNLEGTVREHFEHFDAMLSAKTLVLNKVFELPAAAPRVTDRFFTDGIPASTLLVAGSLAEKLDAGKWLRSCFSNIIKEMSYGTDDEIR